MANINYIAEATNEVTKKALNRSLASAKATKQDEFYTQLSDIEAELKHYTEHFNGKTVLCNCDDPRVSNFFHFFVSNFEKLKLKKLIATCYKNQDADLAEKGSYVEYEGDKNNSRVLDFNGDGDFRSEECIALLKQADIVVTNPPFSLFREYVAQLVKYKKEFLIVGNYSASLYKGVFPLIKENEMWLGVSQPVAFVVPNHYEMLEGGSWRTEDGTNWRRLGNACWFTNFDTEKRHEELPLVENYSRTKFPKYDNYDAVEVKRYKEIPDDYDGVMGVPVTFLKQYNPEQFEIVGSTRGVDQDPMGVYGRSAYLNGKETFKRIFIKRREKGGISNGGY